MKRFLLLLALVPLVWSCDPDDLKLSPTINGFSFSKQSATLGDAEAESALSAVTVGKSKFEGKKGDKVDFQVMLSRKDWGGSPDKLEFYYYQNGKLTYNSATSVTIKINGKYTFLNETWALTKVDDDNFTLSSGSKVVKLKFWKENK